MIEQFAYLTPYNYASNNPITNIDLWGLQGADFRSDLYIAQQLNKKNNNQKGFLQTLRELRSLPKDGRYQNHNTKQSDRFVSDWSRGSYSFNGMFVEAYKETGDYAGSTGASVYFLEGQLEGMYGNPGMALTGGAQGSIFKAEGNLDLGIFTGEDGKAGPLIDANIGVYTAEGEIHVGFSMLGIEYSTVIGGSVGSAHAGVTFGATYDNETGVLTIEGIEHIGFGIGEKAGVQIKIHLPLSLLPEENKE